MRRVFKYASRGFGIRFLPSYVNAVKTFDLHSLQPEEPLSKKELSTPVSMEAIATRARAYFERIFRKYGSWSRSTATLELSHADLDSRNQFTSEPLRRSCLTGFELFFRHVALWEAEQAGQVKIKEDDWASTVRVAPVILQFICSMIDP